MSIDGSPDCCNLGIVSPASRLAVITGLLRCFWRFVGWAKESPECTGEFLRSVNLGVMHGWAKQSPEGVSGLLVEQRPT